MVKKISYSPEETNKLLNSKELVLLRLDDDKFIYNRVSFREVECSHKDEANIDKIEENPKSSWVDSPINPHSYK